MQYKNIDQKLIQIENKIGIINAIKPLNIFSEKRKFFNNKCEYNPQFLYKKNNYSQVSNDIKSALDLITNLNHKTHDPFIWEIYNKKIKEIQLKIKLLKSINKNNNEFPQLSYQLFGKAQKTLVNTAKNIIKLHHQNTKNKNNYNSNKQYRVNRIITEMSKALKKYNLKNKIQINKKTSISNHISVNKKSGTIKISKDYIADKDEINEIIAHEIETHIIRTYNSKFFDQEICFIGTKKYFETEEGLASIMGHIARQKNNFFFHPSILYIAIYTAANNDFATTYSTINNILKNPFQSWNYCLRVKRGIKDTSQKGAFSKDLYLKWIIKTGKTLIRSPILLNYAFLGKANLNELKIFYNQNKISNSNKKFIIPKLQIKDIKFLFKQNQISI